MSGANSSKVKQVIVIRKDLKMRRGKEIAQGAHASVAFLIHEINPDGDKIKMDAALLEWIYEGQAKICVVVNSEEELVDIYKKARAAKLRAHIIRDEGLTEFNGVHTLTACAIGPNESRDIDKITGGLTLY